MALPKIVSDSPSANRSKQPFRWSHLLRVGFLVAGLYFVLNFSALVGERFALASDEAPLSYALLFVAGTLTGFHCAGMCGSLVIGYTVRAAAGATRSKYLIHLLYGAGKTLSYTVLGGVFGLLGSIVSFTPVLRGTIGLLAGLFLILFGLSALDLLPVKRHVQVRLPPAFMRFLGGVLRRAQNPFVIGLLNGLMIICGPLQAMYIMAAGTGQPVEGAKMLFFFGLGTLPLMMGFGFLATALSGQFAPRLVRASNVIVIALGLLMAQRGYALASRGEDLHAAMGHGNPLSASAEKMVHTVLEKPGQINPVIDLQAGIPVIWMVMGDLESCGQSIRLWPEGGVYPLAAEVKGHHFTPTRVGRIEWTCESGATSGAFDVREGNSPPARLPMAESIERLIGQSAEALEMLRSRLHP